MNKEEFCNLIAEISAADLTGVNSAQLSDWFDSLSSVVKCESWVESLTEKEVSELQEQFNRVNDELNSRGIHKLNMADLVKNDPELAETLFSMFPLPELLALEREVLRAKDSEFKTNLLKVLQNCKIRRICYLSLGSDMPS